jgi:hypothetical protein
MIRQGREPWIECKWTSGLAVKFRPGQVGWLFTHWRYGGTAFVFTRRQTKWKRDNVDELYVTDARFARELSAMGLTGVPHLYHGAGGAGAWDWALVEDILRGSAPEMDPSAPVPRRKHRRTLPALAV